MPGAPYLAIGFGVKSLASYEGKTILAVAHAGSGAAVFSVPFLFDDSFITESGYDNLKLLQNIFEWFARQPTASPIAQISSWFSFPSLPSVAVLAGGGLLASTLFFRYLVRDRTPPLVPFVPEPMATPANWLGPEPPGEVEIRLDLTEIDREE